ncbi:MAG: UDP-N-acetylmuramate dehydrogenase [Rhodoferax sp.]
MLVEKNVPLQAFNSFHIVAKAHALVRIASESDLHALLADPVLRASPKFVLGGGSNIVLTGDVKALVLKVELMGRRLLLETDKSYIVEAGAGENWHDLVAWTLAQGYAGLENLALIPGTVGAAPVQNIGAYGVELQDRFDSLDAMDLQTGQVFTLHAAQCAFGYRDSVFKHGVAAAGLDGAVNAGTVSMGAASTGHQRLGLKDRCVILRVRFALPKAWKPVLGYADLDKKMAEHQCAQPSAQQIFDWVCEIRRAKLPDPKVIGNVGSFFKNPTVTPEQCVDIIARDPKVVHYHLADGSVKLAAGWLIDSCGWRGKSVGQAGVFEKQALVLVNRGAIDSPFGATGGEVMTLARAIQTSVYERFGIRLEPEPVVV